MIIRLLEWDSKFFNKRIGKLDFDLALFNKFQNLSQLEDFDLIYIFSPVEVPFEVPLMDIKLTFSKSVNFKEPISEVVQFDANKHQYNQLLELTYQSGHDSRFLKDPSFGLKQFKRLYKQWIDNSITNDDTTVLIHQSSNTIDGFVTLKKSHESAQIGLIAVNPQSQGKGIGKKLIDSVESVLKVDTKLIVATQETNKGACKFYEKLGFRVEKKEYIYHYKHDTIQ